MRSSLTRFSDRVADYVKYRPGYPAGMLPLLQQAFGLAPGSVIADIGSGTGISASVFIASGHTVYAVEPNDAMRHAAENLLGHHPNFISLTGRAEDTGLDAASIDVIFCAQSFHWFRNEATRTEFARILKPGGHIVLVWNIRKEDDPFQQEYEVLLQRIPDYRLVAREQLATEDSIRAFMAPREMHVAALPYEQVFDLPGLLGRIRSSSYFPKHGRLGDSILGAARELFDRYQLHGKITFPYETRIYWC